VRTPREAVADLAVIAAHDSRSHAHVRVAVDGGEHTVVSGILSVYSVPPDSMLLAIDEREIITARLETIRGAWLHTFDGADYYSLSIDLGSEIVTVRDAYNGL
jgi:hypothetical protein